MNLLSLYAKNYFDYKSTLKVVACVVAFIFSAHAIADDEGKEKRAFELYDQINSTDVILGDLALVRGTHPLVKSYAVDLNYRKIREKARNIGLTEGLWKSADGYPEIVPACLADIQGLQTVSTELFDKSFIQHELGYISYAVSTIKNEIMPYVSNPEVKELLNNHLNRLETHKINVKEAMDNLKNDK